MSVPRVSSLLPPAPGAPPRPPVPRRRFPPRRDARRLPGVLRHPGRDLLLVDLDAFYVSVERVRDPSLVGRPVLVGGLPGERGVVACASYEARAYGVRAGMPLFQAAALCPPDTVFLHGDHAAYVAASRKVMEIFERFTPRVETVSLDEAFLDLTGCERHHRSWLDAATKIHRTIADETGLSVSIGIGTTRAVAKVAAALAKPGGVMEVRRGEERAFLSALPLEYLPGVGSRLRRQLARFNLHTVGDLAEVPEAVLAETLGRIGTVLSRRARGFGTVEDEAPVGETEPQTRSISRETSFAEDTADTGFIDAMVSYLGQRASQALRQEGLLVRSVGVRLRYADFQTVEMRRKLPRPTDSDHEILAAARDLWRRRYDRRVRLRLVGVVLHDLIEARDQQLDLPFDGHVVRRREALALPPTPNSSPAPSPSPTSPPPPTPLALPRHERLDRTIDRVRERHGFGALVRGHAIDLLRRLPRSRRGFRLHTPSCSR